MSARLLSGDIAKDAGECGEVRILIQHFLGQGVGLEEVIEGLRVTEECDGAVLLEEELCCEGRVAKRGELGKG